MNERIKQRVEETKASIEPGKLLPDAWIDAYNQKFAELTVEDCIQTLVNNGYTDAAKCLHDVHFGIDDAP